MTLCWGAYQTPSKIKITEKLPTTKSYSLLGKELGEKPQNQLQT